MLNVYLRQILFFFITLKVFRTYLTIFLFLYLFLMPFIYQVRFGD